MSFPKIIEHWLLDDNAANNTVSAQVGTTGNMFTSVALGLNTNNVSVVAPGNLVNGFSFSEYLSDANYFQIPCDSNMQVSDNLSLVIWFKLDTGFPTTNLFTRWQGGGNLVFDLQINSANMVCYFSNDGGWYPSNNVTSTGVTPTAGTLYCAVVTFSAGTAKIYINGVLNNTATGLYSTLYSGSSIFVRIGKDGDGANPLKGWVYEARMYTGTVLDALSVSELWNSGNGTQNELPTNIQDLSTFTKVDTLSQLAVTYNDVIQNGGRTNNVAYIYKDFGAGYFSGDFTHNFTMVLAQNGESWNSFWAMANIVGSSYTIATTGPGMMLKAYYYVPYTHWNIQYYDSNGNFWGEAGAPYWNPDGTFYVTISRTGSTGTFTLYSDPARTIIYAGPYSGTMMTTAFRYLYAFNNRGNPDHAGGNYNQTQDMIIPSSAPTYQPRPSGGVGSGGLFIY